MKKNKIEYRENENGCFIITSHRLNKDGYCNIWQNNRNQRIHRYIYQELFGDIEEGLVVRHKCDVRNCINPEHMELGTPKDNVNDTISRGRRSLGEKSGSNKITEDKAREIKILMSQGKKNYEINNMLKVSLKIISMIRRKKTWNHVVI